MEQGITLIGPAKTYNLPGLPLGFAVIPNRDLRLEFKKACYSLPEPGVFSVIAAKAAFGESREWKNAMVEYLRQNRDYLEKRIRASFPAARLPHVEGTYLQWIDFRPLGMEDPYQWLQEKTKILASNGKIYGSNGEGYVRINFGTRRSLIEEALDRIEEAVKKSGL
jgi:cystathionine beta-lyase